MMPGTWYIKDHTGVPHWPGLGRWRTREAALRGRGYATATEAWDRVLVLATRAAKIYGKHSSPDLRIYDLVDEKERG